MSGVSVTFDGEMSELRQELSSMRGEISDWGSNISKIGVGAFAAWGATQVFDVLRDGLMTVTSAAIEFTNMAREAAQVDAKLAAVIKATGGAAGFTADELANYADELRKITNVDDDAIKGAQTLLATFKEIKGDEFTRATVAALDMAAVLGGDVTSAAGTLGKALNDPLRGVQLLSRQGVVFSDEQEELIKTMVKMGDVSGAQNVILGEMATKYGGAAEAAASAAGGGLTQLSLIIDELKEDIGAKLLPIIDKLTPAFEFVATEIGEEISTLLDLFGELASEVGETFGTTPAEQFVAAVAIMRAEIGELADSLKAPYRWVHSLTLALNEAMLAMMRFTGSMPSEEEFQKLERQARNFGEDSLSDSDRAGLSFVRGVKQMQRDQVQIEASQEEPRQSAEEAAAAAVSRFRDNLARDQQVRDERPEDTTPRTDPNVEVFTKAFSNFSKSVGSQVKGAFDFAGDFAKQFVSGFEAMGKDLPKGGTPAEVPEQFQAAFEGFSDLHRRISLSAASGGGADDKDQKQLQAAEGTHAEAAKSATTLGDVKTLLTEIKTLLGQRNVAVLGP